jgi:hypothetical protein
VGRVIPRLLHVDHHGLAHLAQVGRAGDAQGLLFGFVERGEKNGNEKCDDPDDHQQLNECESFATIHITPVVQTNLPPMQRCQIEH